MQRTATALTLMAALFLLGCETIGPSGLNVPPRDEQLVRLSDAVAARASTLYASLPNKAAPECGFAANAQTYSEMRADAAALGGRVSANDTTMRRAADGLTRAIAGAERSHQLASGTTDDRHGLCLTPGAITLNADAIARATAAINELQQRRSR